MHRGTVGATNLNAELQKTLNPSTMSVSRAGRIFKTGDKVMQIRNNYDKDVFNGDIGRIVTIDARGAGRPGQFRRQDCHATTSTISTNWSLAYATSVHKAQGSEFPAIIMPVMIQHFMLAATKPALHRASPGAKSWSSSSARRKALAIAIRNNKPKLRFTLLKERLQKGGGPQ